MSSEGLDNNSILVTGGSHQSRTNSESAHYPHEITCNKKIFLAKIDATKHDEAVHHMQLIAATTKAGTHTLSQLDSLIRGNIIIFAQLFSKDEYYI